MFDGPRNVTGKGRSFYLVRIIQLELVNRENPQLTATFHCFKDIGLN